VRKEFNGKYLSIADPTKIELEHSLKEIIANNDFRERLSNNQNLIHSMEENYTWESYAGGIIQNISETLEKK